ncbi:c-type cytochrome [Rhizorhapis suberifaciens]|uniref:Cytochrome c n=1 Tax=Rhizorhapis suberifaciens TaxID=13656 RepID=A0A840HYZ0_9SPHN|nr:c-type cytochrome [Rhizorhapis suberifaciens]MBB4642871.1 cytochrome c [Rhizorhapis suberifaciens]
MIKIALALMPPAAALAFLVSAESGSARNVPARPPAFAICAACHTVEPGQTSFGPNLRGLGGRRAASLPGYAYSPALKASGLTWDRATLDAWLTSPQKKVPGTKMPFAGLPDPEKRKQIIDYLMSLK